MAKARRPGLRLPRLQRVVQTLALAGFVALLWSAARGFPGQLLGQSPDFPHDAYLWFDPLAALAEPLAARAVIPVLLLGLGVVLSALVVGRFFCGHLCPLGVSIDLGDKALKSRPEGTLGAPPRRRQWKYLLLAAILGAAVLGVSLTFLGSPLSLATRLWGLVILPAVRLVADSMLAVLAPLAKLMGWNSMQFAEIATPRHATLLLHAALFAGLFALARVSPRFWCRYLCPAGASLALFSFKPLWRRRVNSDCTNCGKCRRACPMNAIPDETDATRYRECIQCMQCKDICPENAIRFSFSGRSRRSPSFVPERRRVLASGLTGAGVGLLAYLGLDLARPVPEVPGNVARPDNVRPPGAVPEADFLARCIRCSECVAACPTNTLQPSVFESGAWGLFSPVAVARMGACDPECDNCGRVCPTGAILPLELEERRWAKMGTAYVLKHKCLAWEYGQACLVCDEVCPYDAIELRMTDQSPVAVPFVEEKKCAGCGACEYRCPIREDAAIQVEPGGAVRIPAGPAGSMRAEAMGRGLDIHKVEAEPVSGAIPGDVQSIDTLPDDSGLPPGFSE